MRWTWFFVTCAYDILSWLNLRIQYYGLTLYRQILINGNGTSGS
jgi:hypothetical protein